MHSSGEDRGSSRTTAVPRMRVERSGSPARAGCVTWLLWRSSSACSVLCALGSRAFGEPQLRSRFQALSGRPTAYLGTRSPFPIGGGTTHAFAASRSRFVAWFTESSGFCGQFDNPSKEDWMVLFGRRSTAAAGSAIAPGRERQTPYFNH